VRVRAVLLLFDEEAEAQVGLCAVSRLFDHAKRGTAERIWHKFLEIRLASRLGSGLNGICWRCGGSMEVPKVPPCQRCGCELELATVVDALGDRPTTYVFKCPQCKRLAPYYRDEDGKLRRW
jgi:hypothetical protein